MHWWSAPLAIQRLLGAGCFAAAICALYSRPGALGALLSWMPLRKLGQWSFSIYLWQQPFYLAAHDDSVRGRMLALALAIGCGLASYFLVERPARAYLNTHWGSGGNARRLTEGPAAG